jgi:hypothetical protein
VTTLRTLPARIEPLPGEALDSWLEALAYRMHMPAGDFLASVGLVRRDRRRKAPDEPYRDWMIQLQPGEAADIAAVTGTTARQVMAMTLSAYDGRALVIDPDSGQVNRRRLWGRNAGSRYCPACLAETGGRWSLEWRLGWSFACVRHGCLLADACPQCGRMQRIRRSRSDRTQDPGHCGYPAVGGTASIRCGADLRDAPLTQLSADHPALSAQRIILDVIEAGQASFGVYANIPAASVHALADVRAIAGRAIAPANAEQLCQRLPPDLIGTYRAAQSSGRPDGWLALATPHVSSAHPGFMAPSHAAVAAAGIMAAIDVLGRESVQEAGTALRWLSAEARSNGQVVNPTTIADWGRSTSPALEAVTLASLQPVLRPSHQLRYRVMSPCPSSPAATATRLSTLVGNVPTLLWPNWAIRLACPGISARSLRAVLSVLLLLPGTKVSTAEAVAMLGHATDRAETSRIVQKLEDLPQWRQILAALTRLSDYLASQPSPIDYQRRRTLNYGSLLSAGEWEQACKVTGAPRGAGYKAHLARAYLFQQLSMLPVEVPPPGVSAPPTEFRADLVLFPTRLFPELAARLDDAAQSFLAAQGITGEPVSWPPPLRLIADLDLPGQDPASIPIPTLHQKVYEGQSPKEAARELGTTRDAVLAVLTETPAPARRISHGQGELSGPRVWAAEIPKEELERLYLAERLSIKQISTLYHIHVESVSHLLGGYGIPIGERPPLGVTPEWLRREYVEARRTMKELAVEVDTSPVTLANWAKKWEIPLRPRGGSQPRSAGDQARDRWPVSVSPKAGFTRDWLRREYVEKERTFDNLAAEVGCASSTLHRWAKRWELPIRPQGGGSKPASSSRTPSTGNRT